VDPFASWRIVARDDDGRLLKGIFIINTQGCCKHFGTGYNPEPATKEWETIWGVYECRFLPRALYLFLSGDENLRFSYFPLPFCFCQVMKTCGFHTFPGFFSSGGGIRPRAERVRLW